MIQQRMEFNMLAMLLMAQLDDVVVVVSKAQHIKKFQIRKLRRTNNCNCLKTRKTVCCVNITLMVGSGAGDHLDCDEALESHSCAPLLYHHLHHLQASTVYSIVFLLHKTSTSDINLELLSRSPARFSVLSTAQQHQHKLELFRIFA